MCSMYILIWLYIVHVYFAYMCFSSRTNSGLHLLCCLEIFLQPQKCQLGLGGHSFVSHMKSSLSLAWWFPRIWQIWLLVLGGKLYHTSVMYPMSEVWYYIWDSSLGIKITHQFFDLCLSSILCVCGGVVRTLNWVKYFISYVHHFIP